MAGLGTGTGVVTIKGGGWPFLGLCELVDEFYRALGRLGSLDCRNASRRFPGLQFLYTCSAMRGEDGERRDQQPELSIS